MNKFVYYATAFDVRAPKFSDFFWIIYIIWRRVASSRIVSKPLWQPFFQEIDPCSQCNFDFGHLHNSYLDESRLEILVLIMTRFQKRYVLLLLHICKHVCFQDWKRRQMHHLSSQLVFKIITHIQESEGKSDLPSIFLSWKSYRILLETIESIFPVTHQFDNRNNWVQNFLTEYHVLRVLTNSGLFSVYEQRFYKLMVFFKRILPKNVWGAHNGVYPWAVQFSLNLVGPYLLPWKK